MKNVHSPSTITTPAPKAHSMHPLRLAIAWVLLMMALMVVSPTNAGSTYFMRNGFLSSIKARPLAHFSFERLRHNALPTRIFAHNPLRNYVYMHWLYQNLTVLPSPRTSFDETKRSGLTFAREATASFAVNEQHVTSMPEYRMCTDEECLKVHDVDVGPSFEGSSERVFGDGFSDRFGNQGILVEAWITIKTMSESAFSTSTVPRLIAHFGYMPDILDSQPAGEGQVPAWSLWQVGGNRIRAVVWVIDSNLHWFFPCDSATAYCNVQTEPCTTEVDRMRQVWLELDVLPNVPQHVAIRITQNRRIVFCSHPLDVPSIVSFDTQLGSVSYSMDPTTWSEIAWMQKWMETPNHPAQPRMSSLEIGKAMLRLRFPTSTSTWYSWTGTVHQIAMYGAGALVNPLDNPTYYDFRGEIARSFTRADVDTLRSYGPPNTTPYISRRTVTLPIRQEPYNMSLPDVTFCTDFDGDLITYVSSFLPSNPDIVTLKLYDRKNASGTNPFPYPLYNVSQDEFFVQTKNYTTGTFTLPMACRDDFMADLEEFPLAPYDNIVTFIVVPGLVNFLFESTPVDQEVKVGESKRVRLGVRDMHANPVQRLFIDQVPVSGTLRRSFANGTDGPILSANTSVTVEGSGDVWVTFTPSARSNSYTYRYGDQHLFTDLIQFRWVAAGNYSAAQNATFCVLSPMRALHRAETFPINGVGGEVTLAGLDELGSTFVYTILTLPANGALYHGNAVNMPIVSTPFNISINKIRYRYPAGVVADPFDSFVYRLTNMATGAISNNATVTITIRPVVMDEGMTYYNRTATPAILQYGFEDGQIAYPPLGPLTALDRTGRRLAGDMGVARFGAATWSRTRQGLTMSQTLSGGTRASSDNPYRLYQNLQSEMTIEVFLRSDGAIRESNVTILGAGGDTNYSPRQVCSPSNPNFGGWRLVQASSGEIVFEVVVGFPEAPYLAPTCLTLSIPRSDPGEIQYIVARTRPGIVELISKDESGDLFYAARDPIGLRLDAPTVWRNTSITLSPPHFDAVWSGTIHMIAMHNRFLFDDEVELLHMMGPPNSYPVISLNPYANVTENTRGIAFSVETLNGACYDFDGHSTTLRLMTLPLRGAIYLGGTSTRITQLALPYSIPEGAYLEFQPPTDDLSTMFVNFTCIDSEGAASIHTTIAIGIVEGPPRSFPRDEVYPVSVGGAANISLHARLFHGGRLSGYKLLSLPSSGALTLLDGSPVAVDTFYAGDPLVLTYQSDDIADEDLPARNLIAVDTFLFKSVKDGIESALTATVRVNVTNRIYIGNVEARCLQNAVNCRIDLVGSALGHDVQFFVFSIPEEGTLRAPPLNITVTSSFLPFYIDSPGRSIYFTPPTLSFGDDFATFLVGCYDIVTGLRSENATVRVHVDRIDLPPTLLISSGAEIRQSSLSRAAPSLVSAAFEDDFEDFSYTLTIQSTLPVDFTLADLNVLMEAGLVRRTGFGYRSGLTIVSGSLNQIKRILLGPIQVYVPVPSSDPVTFTVKSDRTGFTKTASVLVDTDTTSEDYSPPAPPTPGSDPNNPSSPPPGFDTTSSTPGGSGPSTIVIVFISLGALVLLIFVWWVW